jgi:hypothetical protein
MKTCPGVTQAMVSDLRRDVRDFVLCVDEKPGIQALERSQGWLRLPDGRSLTGFAHEYKRHGTTTLFAALEVASGLIQTGHHARRRRREFLDFMNDVLAAHPDPNLQIHVVLDNLSTHKPKHDRWLARHRNVHFHFTPTHASWLNQVEVWFSILERAALRGASHTSPRQVRDAIERFAAAYNEVATPFEWQQREIHQVGLTRHYSDLRNLGPVNERYRSDWSVRAIEPVVGVPSVPFVAGVIELTNDEWLSSDGDAESVREERAWPSGQAA